MDPKQFGRRILGVVVILAVLMTVLCSNLYSIQYTNGAEYARESVARTYETETVPASRGPILDRNGQVLVSNQISYQVTLSLSLMGKTEEERCQTLLSLIQVCREEGVTWADSLPMTTTAPFAYTVERPFYTAETDENGETVYSMTQLGRLAVYMGWIEDPEDLAEGEIPESETAGGEEPGLWDKIKAFFGMGPEEEPQEEPEPYQLPTAEELLGMMCRDFGIQGEGAVDEDAAEESGGEVPTLNIGDMSQTDARAAAGVLFELYYRNRITNWPLYYFAEDVDVDFITRVKELGLKGVEIETTSVRKYETEYAAHILGRVASMEADVVDYYLGLDQGYTQNDKVGREGAELAFESYLHGEPGVRAITRNEEGKVTSSVWLPDEETGEAQAPQPGDNVFLTIDIELQKMVEDLLAARVPGLSDQVEGAACVVQLVDTGEILAAASYPTFSLTTYNEDYQENYEDPLKPFLNRAFSGLYPPGSTFKMITAVAGLETEKITPSTKIKDEGRYTRWPSPQPQCWIFRQYGGNHGLVNVTEAIEVSCNYFFYEVGYQVGIEALDRYAEMFGLGQKTGIEVGESAGTLASPEYTESRGGTWYEGNIASVAIGQESTQVTPIQLTNYISTLVNGGTRYSTHLLKEVKSSDFSQVIYEYEPQVQAELDIAPENLEAVTQGMHDLTTNDGSLANAFRNVPVEVGAKTGSAQVSSTSDSNAVFVCYAPYDDPEIAVSLVVEHGGSGSVLASLAAEILTYYFTAPDSQGDIVTENTLVP